MSRFKFLCALLMFAFCICTASAATEAEAKAKSAESADYRAKATDKKDDVEEVGDTLYARLIALSAVLYANQDELYDALGSEGYNALHSKVIMAQMYYSAGSVQWGNITNGSYASGISNDDAGLDYLSMSQWTSAYNVFDGDAIPLFLQAISEYGGVVTNYLTPSNTYAGEAEAIIEAALAP